MSKLEIRGLQVVVNTDKGQKEILKGVDLTVNSGETHAIMGPNGSGKSTLAYAIAGHPKYEITGGSVTLDGVDVLELSVDERAKAGLFLAMQYPVEVPGVSVSNFLRTAATALRGEAPNVRKWVGEVKDAMAALKMDPAFAERSVNEGFSGGEKKRNEILQMAGRVHGRVAGSEVFILSDRDLVFEELRPGPPEFQLAGDAERVAIKPGEGIRGAVIHARRLVDEAHREGHGFLLRV